MHISSRKGFTLIELLVVIAIIAILAVVVVLTLNPAELLRQSRDANRVSDMATLTNALNLYNTDQGGSQSYSLGSASTAYVSIPDSTATSTAGDQCQGLGMPSLPSGSYHCDISSSNRNVNGTGWIPVNFSAITSGSPLGSLPVDPTNQTSSNLFYTYQTNGTQFETTAFMESQKYQSLAANDGGNYSNLYENGSSLALALADYANPPAAAPSYIGGGFQSGASTMTVTYTSTAGNLLVACGYSFTTSSTFAFSDSASQSWTSLAVVTGTSNRIQCAYVANSASVAWVKLIITNSGGTPRLAVAEFSGVKASSPLENSAGQNSSGSSPSSGAFTVTSGDLIVGWAAPGSSLAAGSGFSTVQGDTTGLMEYQVISGTSASTTYSSGYVSSITVQGMGFLPSVASVNTPTVDNGSGTYLNTVTVHVSDSTIGATLCYTADGTDPTAITPGTCSHGLTYSSAPTFTTSTVLKVIGTKSGLGNSVEISGTYTVRGPTSFYVSNAGSDSNSGADASDTWAHAPGMTGCTGNCASAVLLPGDTIYLNRGDSWTNTMLTVPTGGSSSAQITLTSYGTGAQPIISSPANQPAITATADNRGYWTISDLDLRATGSVSGIGYALAIYHNLWDGSGGSEGLVPGWIIQSSTIEAPTFLFGPNTIVRNNIFNGAASSPNNIFGGITIRGVTSASSSITGNTVLNFSDRGIWISNGAGSSTISNNVVYNIASGTSDSGVGIDLDGAAIPTWGNQIDHNTVYNCSFFGISHENAFNSKTFDNVIHDCAYGGMSFINYGANRSIPNNGMISDNIIYNTNVGVELWDASYWTFANNTIYHGTGSSPAGFNVNSASTYVNHLTFVNNIIAGTITYPIYVPDSASIWAQLDYDDIPPVGTTILYEASGGAQTLTNLHSSGLMTHGITGDPVFISTSTPDFHLQATSPAIDAGTNAGLTADFAGTSVPQGPAPDIGAYEYIQTSTPSIAWLSPSASSTVSSTITISASSTAVAPASISSVQFYLNGSPLGSPVTSTSSPNTYPYSWDTTGVTNASHTLYALATDSYGNSASSSPITVTVANAAVLSVPTSLLNFFSVQGSTTTLSQSVVVTNKATALTTLNWSATSTQSWLTFSPSSGSLAGSASTSLSFIADPTGLAIGTYDATATITDPNASGSPQYIPVSFTISTTGIGTTLLSPTDGTIATGTISVSATATSTVGIASVQFYLDGSPLGSAVASNPYTTSWNTLPASDGSHTLYSQATDNNSNIASSSEITITVDNTPPAISIISPTGGATVSGTTSITASSSDVITGVSSVAFYLDGSLLGESTSSPYSVNWDTTQTSNASHDLTAIATDGAGNATTSQAIAVTVYNAPSVSSGGGGGGVPQSALIIVPTAASTASSTASSSLPLVIPTPTASSTLITTSSLQAELNTLLAEFQRLEAQAGASSSNTPISYVFTTDLQLWDEGPEVTALQGYLIQQDKGPAVEKLKAHGRTKIFGFLTYNALVEFQASVGIHATGYFGPITRAYVNGNE